MKISFMNTTVLTFFYCKKFTVVKNHGFKILIASLIAIIITAEVSAQNKNSIPSFRRCGTMEALKEKIKQQKKNYQNPVKSRPGSLLSLPGPVVIPVVVHIVLPNPWVVTDDDVQRLIDRLNLDYSGLNEDSTNAISFYPVRGHSLIRFTLAKRDVNGKFTTGIVRVPGTTPISITNNQDIKKSSTPTGGSTGWDVTKYYNIYIGDGTASGLLGISPEIGPGGPAGSDNADGVCIDYRSLGNKCFVLPNYKLARTAVHETGHNFGLYHTFEDGCDGNDFMQLTSSGCVLPAELLSPADDVPPQFGSSIGCPAPGTINGCTPAAELMFQNYMDYSHDSCYSMFTKGEVKRMEWVLENCRPGYLTTNGGQYPGDISALDAAIHSVVNPGGFDFDTANCKPIQYPPFTCPGNFTPLIRITNQGTTTLTSVTVTTTINNINPSSKTFSLNLATGRSQVIELPYQTTVTGFNNLKFTLSLPNGGTDGDESDDTLSISFTVAPLLTLPYAESFEDEIFPPANGSLVINADGKNKWQRTTLAGNPGNACLYIYLYNFIPPNVDGEKDLYRLPKIDVSGLDSVTLSFNVAYRQYASSFVPVPPNDSLRILYSPDCGATWLPTEYAKGGAALATVSPPTESVFFPESAEQWRREKLTEKDFCSTGTGSIMLAFESTGHLGNNIFIDNIDVRSYASVNRNAAIKEIQQPLHALCENNFTPIVKLSNEGFERINSLNINYKIDNGPVSAISWTGNLARCDTALVELPVQNSNTGTHTFTAYLSDINGGTDDANSNDTLQKIFTIYPAEDMPVAEGFENENFPGSNWGIQNVNSGTGFERSTSAARTGTASVKINNAVVTNFYDAVDYLISPIVKNTGLTDSIFVDFDYAYRLNSADTNLSPLDTLEILTTADCGETFTSVLKKWGNGLKTVNDFSSAAFTPSSVSDWRHERVYLTPSVRDNDFQLYFAMKGNKQNNLWLDNVNISSVTLPPRLKEQGYLIYPNPFSSSFVIHHYAEQPPVDLQSVQVYSSSAQLIWQKTYNGNAERKINIDLKTFSRGLYFVKMIYKYKNVVEKIIKH